MSEQWPPTPGPEDQAGDAPTPPAEAAPGGAIPLPGPAAEPVASPPPAPQAYPAYPVTDPYGGPSYAPATPGPAPAGGWATAPPPPWGQAGPRWDPTTQQWDPAVPPAAAGWGGTPGGGPPPTGAVPPYGYPYVPAAPTRTRGHNGPLVGVAALVAAVALLLGAGLGHAVWPAGQATSASVPSGGGAQGGTTSPFGGASGNGSSTGAGAPADIAGIAGKVDAALVDINTNLSYQDAQAAGTGMVLTADGEVLTNNHVIDGATSISVTDVGNGKTYKAHVVGYDRTGDIAVIQMEGASGLQTVTPSNRPAQVGQAVVGVGNAGGTGGTPSTAGGSVTATDQSITASDQGGGNSENLTGLIETNANIQPGDSGGALVDTSGHVLGMDTAASTGSSYQITAAQSYAIPITTALSVAREIMAGHASSTIHIGPTGFLGIQVQASTAASAPSGNGSNGFGFGTGGGSGSSGTGQGAVVVGALAGSPGAQAGLGQGDVITALDGSQVTSASDLTNLLQAHHPGDTVHVTWTDSSGQTHTAAVTLTTGPPA